MNLVAMAETLSPACQQLIFIVARKGSAEIEANYSMLRSTFEVINAVRMTKRVILPLIKPESQEQTLKGFGFYSMAI